MLSVISLLLSSKFPIAVQSPFVSLGRARENQEVRPHSRTWPDPFLLTISEGVERIAKSLGQSLPRWAGFLADRSQVDVNIPPVGTAA